MLVETRTLLSIEKYLVLVVILILESKGLIYFYPRAHRILVPA